VTTERAPVAGAASSTPRQSAQNLLSQVQRGQIPSSSMRDLNELFQLTARGAEGRAAQLGGLGASGAAEESGSGAAAAAGVLTAVDEDGEGDEEAAVPGEFDYFTDAEDDE